VSTVSSGSLQSTEDDQYFDLNGTLPDRGNRSATGNTAVRVGVLDLKAPDIEYPGLALRFDVSPIIPAGAAIVSASVSGAAASNTGFPQNGTLTLLISAMLPDGRWNILAGTPEQWRRTYPSTLPINASVEIKDTSGATIATTGVVSGFNNPVDLRKYSDVLRNQKFGQILIVTSPKRLASAIFELKKFGAPAGSIWAEVWQVAGGLPDRLLATSDVRDVSTISATKSFQTFSFSGPDRLQTFLGQNIAVVLAGDWPESLSSYVSLYYGGGSYAGEVVSFGEGGGFDSSHYIAAQEVLDIEKVPGVVVWSPPTFVENTIYSTPDLASIIQGVVSDPSYVEGSPFGIAIERLTPTQLFTRSFKAFASLDTPATVPDVSISIEWDYPPIDTDEMHADVGSANPSASLERSSPASALSMASPSAIVERSAYGATIENANPSGADES